MSAKQKQSASFVSIIFAKLLPLPFPPSGCLLGISVLSWSNMLRHLRAPEQMQESEGFASHKHTGHWAHQPNPADNKKLQKIRVVRFVLLFYLNNKTWIVKPNYAARDLFKILLLTSIHVALHFRAAAKLPTLLRHEVHIRSPGLPPQVRPLLQHEQWRGRRGRGLRLVRRENKI